jgi:hypothetical protein
MIGLLVAAAAALQPHLSSARGGTCSSASVALQPQVPSARGTCDAARAMRTSWCRCGPGSCCWATRSRCWATRSLGLNRRALCASAVFWASLPANAYDSIQPVTVDLEALEKKRAAREATISKNKASIKPLLKAIETATTPTDYGEAADSLTVWMIGRGPLPEGIDAPEVRDVLQDSYQALQQKPFACEMTRALARLNSSVTRLSCHRARTRLAERGHEWTQVRTRASATRRASLLTARTGRPSTSCEPPRRVKGRAR